jgi:hypothetical protein
MSEFQKLSKEEQMAFLINAYNAFTVQLILDHYPVASIRDIGGRVLRMLNKPWDIAFFSLLDGKIRTIDPIEHEYLRPHYKDYRIHAAVNCASASCPALLNEAFTGERLQQQLDRQMKRWLEDTSKNRVDHSNKTIYLSKIMDWYSKDFEEWGGGIRKVMVRHAPQLYEKAVKDRYQIRYLKYSWDLNDHKSN